MGQDVEIIINAKSSVSNYSGVKEKMLFAQD